MAACAIFEHYQFRLVREALQEREVLLAKAPHIIWPLRFVLPHSAGQRPAALIRAGLFLYDHLARRHRIPGSSAIELGTDRIGAALRPEIEHGFSYWDCWVDTGTRGWWCSTRGLPADHGAEIATRTRVSRVNEEAGFWRVILEADGQQREVRARGLVDAAGPWVDTVASLARGDGEAPARPRLRLVKGSHIVVPQIAGAEDACLFQNSDGRVVFALPFAERFTLIGTTDMPYSGDPADAAISPEESAYLIGVANRYFRQPIAASNIVWTFAGVRPLYDDARRQSIRHNT